MPVWRWAPGQVLGRFSPQTYCRHKSRHADQHLLVPQVSALLSGNQKDLEMEFGCFAVPLGRSAPWILLSRKQLRRNWAPLRGAHYCVDLINLLYVERQKVYVKEALLESTVREAWLLVDARLRGCRLHWGSCGIKEMLWIWRDQGCSVSPQWCYCGHLEMWMLQVS